MASEIVYAILDDDSGLFVTKHVASRLDELGVDTALFNSKSDAMRAIEAKPYFEFSDVSKNTRLQNELAWWLLEKLYKTDRWHIDCSIKEFNDAVDNFKHLKVVPINLEYNQT